MSILNFSIIIPHRNTPDLLEYCLHSIPIRNDVQVIVVDDNSDPSIVDFENFPSWKGSHFKCYYTKTGRGAGYARNIGLEHSQGKWVLFIDADDYLSEDSNSIFDAVKNSTSDIIYTRSRAVMLYDRETPSRRADIYNEHINKFLTSNDDSGLRLSFWVPWAKFFKLDFIRNIGVEFDEIPYANDTYFSIKCGCSASIISVIDRCFYYVTESTNSLTSNIGSKPGEPVYRAYGLFHSQVAAAKCGYKGYVDEVRQTLSDWYYCDRILFLRGVSCMRKEGFSLFFILSQLFSDMSFCKKVKESLRVCKMLSVKTKKIQKNECF